MSRHEITNDKGTWAFGWDQPLLSFYLQLYDGDVEPDDNPCHLAWCHAEDTDVRG
jgi:hypothetical protein